MFIEWNDAELEVMTASKYIPRCHHVEMRPRLSWHLGNSGVAVMTKHVVSILLHKGKMKSTAMDSCVQI